MASGWLLADAAVDLAVGLGYGRIAWRLYGMEPAVDESRARSAIALWWAALAGTGFVAAAMSLEAYAWPKVALFGALSFLAVFAFTLGMAGLALHLARLFAPHAGTYAIIFLAYGAYVSIQAFLLIGNVPRGIVMQGWRPVLDTAPPPDWLLALSFALVLVPPLVGAAAYSLAKRPPSGMTRPRARLVSLSLVLWLVSVLLISVPQLAGAFAWQAASRVMVLAAAVVLARAYVGRADRAPAKGSSQGPALAVR